MMRSVLVLLALLGATSLGAVALGQDRRRGADGAPRVGDVAPIFTAKVLGKDESVCLDTVIKKEKRPVVLIFGSYT